jgi:hypothetical protein
MSCEQCADDILRLYSEYLSVVGESGPAVERYLVRELFRAIGEAEDALNAAYLRQFGRK